MRWTATTASHCRLLNPEKATFHTLAPILLFIHRYIAPFITRISFVKSSQALQRMIHNEPDSMLSFRWPPTLVNTLTLQDSPRQDPIQFSLLSAVGVIRLHAIIWICSLIESCSQVLRRAETTSRHRRTLGSERAELTHLRFQNLSLID